MYYKLLNKNVITAALISLITLGASGVCEAQGVVSLVEEENIVSPQNNTAENTKTETVDTDSEDVLPDVLPEADEFIPFDNEGLISPTPVAEAQEDPAEQQEPLTDEETEFADEEAELSVSDDSNSSEDVEADIQKQQDEFAENKELSSDDNESDFDSFDEGEFNLGLDTSAAKPKNKANALLSGKLRMHNNLLNEPKEKANEDNDADNSEDTISQVQPQNDIFANSVLSKIDNDLFSQMSDIEKQTTLLTLELRREKLRNEIEAIKAQRTKAEEEKLSALEMKKRQEIEWEKEQEAKVLKEKQALKEKEIEMEKLLQKKALNLYMNKMMQEKQEWLNENAQLYKKIQEIENNRNEIAENFKQKLDNLTTVADKMIQVANSAKNNHDRNIASLTAQNVQLKKRIEADSSQKTDVNTADINSNLPAFVATESPINLSKEYAILDISGKGDNLEVKLINKNGDSFIARKGTVLQSGFMVDEITLTYVRFERNGSKQYLYTTGSIEPERLESDEPIVLNASSQATPPSKAPRMGSNKMPSLATGMFVK